jgi:uncharacterized protein (DUF433 family)
MEKTMKKKLAVLIGGLLVVLLTITVIGVTNAYAQTPSSGLLQGPGPDGGRGPMGGRGLETAAKVLGMTTDELQAALQSGKTLEQIAEEKGVDFADVQAAMQTARGTEMRGLKGGAGLDAAAKVLGMTTDELTTALQSGKTLEQVAEEKGVDFADVQAAMQTARDTEMRARIQQALDDGTITQEHADWLLEGLDKGFLNGPGGFGFDGPHGPGQGPAPAGGAQPTRRADNNMCFKCHSERSGRKCPAAKNLYCERTPERTPHIVGVESASWF